MNYTRGKLIASPAYGEDGKLCYYNVELSGQSLASFHENQYINVDMDQAKGNAELYAKSAEMFEALKDQIELEKADCKYVHSAISKERHQIRLGELELLIKEIEK